MATSHIPVLVNKKSALWFMDTGANISVMSDAEAAALGLVVHTVDTKMTDISGTVMAFKITQIDELTIGRTHLKHVSFVVLPHTPASVRRHSTPKSRPCLVYKCSGR